MTMRISTNNTDKHKLDKIKTLLSLKYWRLNNLYHIIDKYGKTAKMKLNFAQQLTFSVKHPRSITLKSRQQGISTYRVIESLDACIMLPNHQAGVQSYGKVEAQKLYTKAMYAWEHYPQELKNLLNIDIKSASVATGVTFTNGSSLRIGNFRGDTLQRLHISELAKIAKTYPEKATELKTGAFQAVAKGNIISIESTAEGKQGMFYEMWRKAEARYNLVITKKQTLTPLDFYPIFLSWVIDPDCNLSHFVEPTQEAIDYIKQVEDFFNEYDNINNIYPNRKYLLYPKLNPNGTIAAYLYPAKNFTASNPNYPPIDPKAPNIYKQGYFTLTSTQKNWLSAKLVELDDYMNQEYPYSPDSAFDLPLHGTFFKTQFALLQKEKWRLKPHPYDPRYPVYVSFDIGAKDYTVLYFAQVRPIRYPDGTIHLTPILLWEYESNDTLGAEHYAEVIYHAKDPYTKQEFFPNYRAIILPHDGNKTEWTTGRTPFEILASYGLPVVTLPELLSFADSIQVARDFINIAIFSGTPNLLIGIQNYRRRYDKQLQTYLDKDIHDINSDRAASLRYLAQYLFFDTKIKPRNFSEIKKY